MAYFAESIQVKGPTDRLPLENDDNQRKGRVYLIRDESSGGGERWALGVHFENDGVWAKIEGLNCQGALEPCYEKMSSEPSGQLIIPSPVPQNTPIPEDFLSIFTPSFYRAVSAIFIEHVKISPLQLRRLAISMPVERYIEGLTDCQTWLLDALTKLRIFQTEEDCSQPTQSEHHVITETITPVRSLDTTMSASKVGGSYSNDLMEMWDTTADNAKELGRGHHTVSPGRSGTTSASPKERGAIGNMALEMWETTTDTTKELYRGHPILATNRLVNGVGQTGDYAVTGVASTANYIVDGCAGVATNVVGTVTGGHAVEGGIWTNVKKSADDVHQGKNVVLASVGGVGRTTGAVVNGVGRTTTGVVGGVAGTASGLLHNTAGTITGTFSAFGDSIDEVRRGERNFVTGVGVGAGKATLALGGGVVKTVGGVAKGVVGTGVGAVKNVFGIFK